MPETVENLNSKAPEDGLETRSETNHTIQQIKSKILAYSIEEDQQAVADQWVKTFQYGAENPGLLMAKFVIACIAKGDFKVRSNLSENLHAPNEVLTVIDYLSHASRIIVDYQSLSNEHKKTLLTFFPKPTPDNKIYSRAATHAVSRKEGTICELKGIQHGVMGLFPALIRKERDFGVNVAMGGEEQPNFIGKKIRANGYSGHVYLHHEEEASLLMFGLEQSAPLGFEGWGKLLNGNEESNDSYQYGIDQFQQAHSALGASDTFTAAGSLYFSDPVYQAKLLTEKNCCAPGKYGAMQVTITDQNWNHIISFLEDLTNSDATEDSLRKMLVLKPCSASTKRVTPGNFIFIEFPIYFDRIYEVFIANNQSIDESIKAEIQQVQQNLIEDIQKVKDGGDVNSFDNALQLIKSLSEFEGLPQEYVAALERIEQMFKRQLEVDPQLREKAYKTSLACKARELQAETEKLLFNAIDIQEYFMLLSLGHQHQEDGDEILEDAYITGYLSRLTQLIADLKANQKSSCDRAEDKIKQLETLCETANQILHDCPKLFSQAVIEKVKRERDEQNVKNMQLEQTLASQEVEYRNKLQQKELALIEAKGLIDSLEKKGIEDQGRAQEAERNLTRLQQEKDRVNRRLMIVMPVINEIENLKDKRTDLKKRNHGKAAKDLKELYKAVENGIKAYTESNETNEDVALTGFKTSLTTKISEVSNKGNLKKHRNIIAQLLKIVVTLGASLLVNGVSSYRKRGSSEFFPVTDTMNKVRKLEDKTINLIVK